MSKKIVAPVAKPTIKQETPKVRIGDGVKPW